MVLEGLLKSRDDRAALAAADLDPVEGDERRHAQRGRGDEGLVGGAQSGLRDRLLAGRKSAPPGELEDHRARRARQDALGDGRRDQGLTLHDEEVRARALEEVTLPVHEEPLGPRIGGQLGEHDLPQRAREVGEGLVVGEVLAVRRATVGEDEADDPVDPLSEMPLGEVAHERDDRGWATDRDTAADGEPDRGLHVSVGIGEPVARDELGDHRGEGLGRGGGEADVGGGAGEAGEVPFELNRPAPHDVERLEDPVGEEEAAIEGADHGALRRHEPPVQVDDWIDGRGREDVRHEISLGVVADERSPRRLGGPPPPTARTRRHPRHTPA